MSELSERDSYASLEFSSSSEEESEPLDEVIIDGVGIPSAGPVFCIS